MCTEVSRLHYSSFLLLSVFVSFWIFTLGDVHTNTYTVFLKQINWFCNTDVSETPNGFLNLKTSLPTMQCFHTDRHHVQCCLEFSWDGNVSVCVNKFFHFALKCYFISKTVRCFWHTCIMLIIYGMHLIKFCSLHLKLFSNIINI
jgi:hypothetical protein